MKFAVCSLVPVCLLCAQERSTTVNLTKDANGNWVEGATVSEVKTNHSVERTERLESVNGRLVPRESVQERVIREDSSGKTVERMVQRYDPNGNPGPPEKTLIEEQRHGDSTTIRTSTYRGDLNGNMQLAQRSVSQKRKSGSSETTETLVEQPGLNGSLETVEKKVTAKTGSGNGAYQQDVTTYRWGESGIYVAQRLVTSHAETNGRSTDNTAEYEVGSTGTLVLHSQTISRTATRPDGSQVSEVDVYGAAVAGTVGSAEAGLKLAERQLIDRKKDAGGSLETVSVQRPTISDPGVLGPREVIAERVCRGKCD